MGNPLSKTAKVSAAAIAGSARQALLPDVVSTKRKRSALAVAAIADMIQLGFFEGFQFGAVFPPDIVLDGIVAIVLTCLLGFRWRLVFALGLELLPAATLFPSWTAFVMSLQSADNSRSLERAEREATTDATTANCTR